MPSLPTTVSLRSSSPRTVQTSMVVPAVPAVQTRVRQPSPGFQGTRIQPISVPTTPIVKVTVPVESISPKPLVQAAPTSQSSIEKTAVEKNLLSRIDGVVSEMERELSEDLILCDGRSPMRGGKQSPCHSFAVAAVGEGTIDWIDKQIWAIEHRKEACELRQAHLADLRRMVSDGSHSFGPLEKALGSEGSMAGSSTVLGCSDEDLALVPAAPSLAALEAEHELLKQEVRNERADLQRVRQILESECETRLQEVRTLAEAAEGGKHRALAAEEAAELRAKEAMSEAARFQGQLQQAEVLCEQKHRACMEATEAQLQAGHDLQLLEENSRAVLEDCRALQGKVRELQAERAALVTAQAGFEEQRRMLQMRIRTLEEQRSEAEVQRQALVDENYSLSREHNGLILSRDQQSLQEESSVLRREALFREELAQRDATLTAAKASWCHAEEARSRQSSAQILELETELSRLQQQVGDALAAEAGAERRARTWSAEAEQRHLALVAEAESLRSELVDSRAMELKERSAREEMERRYAQAELAAEQAQAEHSKLRDAEKEARRDFEQSQADHSAEQQSRKEVEQKHARTNEDLDLLRSEHQRLLANNAEVEGKQQEVEREKAGLLKDLEKLREDLAAESKAKQHLDQLLQEERQAKEDLEAKHQQLEEARRQACLDCDELQKAKEEERQKAAAALQEEERLNIEVRRLQQGLEAERQRGHQLATGDLPQLQRDLEAERNARQELEAKWEHDKSDLQRIQLELERLRSELTQERRAREEVEQMHKVCTEDLERMREARRDAEQQLREVQDAKELMETQLESEGRMQQHRASRLALEQEQHIREELERRHQDERERYRSATEEARLAERQAFEELQRFCNDLSAEKLRIQGELDRLVQRSDAEVQVVREEADRKLRLSQEEAEELASRSTQQLRKLEGQQDLLERSLKQARQELEEEKRRNGDLELQCSQLRNLEQDLEEARNAVLRLRADLDQARLAEENLKRDAEEAMEKSSEAKRKVEIVWKTKLEQAQREIDALRAGPRKSLAVDRLSLPVDRGRVSSAERLSLSMTERLAGLQRRASGESAAQPAASDQQSSVYPSEEPSQAEPQNSARVRMSEQRSSLGSERPSLSDRPGKAIDELRRKHSLWVEPMAARASISGMLDNSQQAEGIRQKVRDSKEGIRELLIRAGHFHVEALRFGLEALVKARDERGLGDLLRDSKRKPESIAVQGQLKEELAGMLANISALKAELLESSLRPEEHRQITELLDLEVARCEEEEELLARSNPLEDVPEALMELLLGLWDGEKAITWPGNFSPAHWSALHGRRDFIAYIAQQPWGMDMVSSRDDDGRTPIFYAEHARSKGERRSGLVSYLREDLRVTTPPCQPTASRPADLSMLDVYKQEILSTVETEGWHAVKWKDGKTMLHWAAEKGHGELCRYLISIGADLEAKDSHSRTAALSASRTGKSEVADLLQAARDNPREWLYLSAFQKRT